MRTSPLQSLQKTAPKSYMTLWHLNLQPQMQIQLNFRGLSAKLALHAFEKGSNGQTIITMQFLVKNYPSFIYGMGNFEIEQLDKKIKEITGAELQIDHTPKFRGVKCQIEPHH